MTIRIEKEVTDLIADPETVKVLATIDESGFPHVVTKKSLHFDEQNHLVYVESLESSRTNKNMVRSIWFNHKVAVTLIGKNGNSYQIKGQPVRAIISGPLFRKYYEQTRARLGEVDLATVWVIEPEEVINQTFQIRKEEEEHNHPYFKHLDRLAKS